MGVRVFVVLAGLMMIPALAHAQSTIAGVVKDQSGDVLPGVQVEAASPVLIEGTKTTFTDGEGNYKLIDLRPGTYVITFTLQGFAQLKHSEIVVPADSTVTVNSDMKLGSLSESITVTSAAPLVDVASASRTQQLDKAAMEMIPTSRTIQSMGQLIPGVTINVGVADVGGSNAAMQSYMTVRGIPAAQNVVMVDGMIVNGVEANGAIQSYFNDAASDQIVYQTSDSTASTSGGGVQVNMIPREGGNRFAGDLQAAYRPGEGSPILSGLQGNNLSTRLQDMKIATQPGQVYISDLTVSEGGPVMKNKVWFFASARDNRVNNYVLDTKFDDGSPGDNAEYIRDLLGRGTGQLTPKIKVTGYYDRVSKHRAHAMSALQDPETAAVEWTSPNYSTGAAKGTWSATPKLLIDGGYSFNIELRDQTSTGIRATRNMDPISLMGTPGYQTNAWYSNVSETSDVGGRQTSAATTFSQEWPRQATWQASATYITGSHTFKGGFQDESGLFLHTADTNGDLERENYTAGSQDPTNANWTFAQPKSVVITNTPRIRQERMNHISGIYAQDQYRYKRLTVNAGIRWEYVNSQVDRTEVPAGRWVPARVQPEVKNVPNWKDWAPRSSFVYDVFGNGRTAVKYSLNRYNSAETTTTASGFNILATQTSSRQWTDLNGDGIAQGARVWNDDGTFGVNHDNTDCVYQTAGCEIYLSGPSGVDPVTGLAQTLTPLAANFGLPGSIPLYNGFPRQYRIEQGVEFQHQLLPRLSVTMAYVHWQRYNNTVPTSTTASGSFLNRYRTADQYTAMQFFNPISGEPVPYQYYNLSTAGSTLQNQAGGTISMVEPLHTVKYNSYQFDFRARPYRGAQIFGGATFQRTRSVQCDTSTDFVIDPNQIRFCDQNDLLGDGSNIGTPFTKDFKIAFSVPVWYNFTFSAAYQNLDQGAFTRTFTYGKSSNFYPDGSAAFVDSRGVILAATPCPAGQAVCAVPGATSAPSTLTATSTTQNIDIPGLLRDERLSQIDIKLARTFRTKSLTISPTFEAFNLTNGDTIINRSSVNYPSTKTAVGGASTYLRPSDVLKPRLIGFGVIVKW